MSLSRAIGRYHELLAGDLAAETQGALDAHLARAGLFFGERPLCTVLRPRLLTPDAHAWLERRSAILLGAFARGHRAAMADAALRAEFGLADWEERLLHDDPGFPDPSPTSRLDAFMTGEGTPLLLTEYNAETPAGLAYADALAELFLALPVVGEYLREYDLRPLPARQAVLHPLLEAFRRWAGRREAPRIAILDWKEVPTYSEFVLFERYFRSLGIPVRIVDPRHVEFRDGRLVADDFHITLIYKRVLLSELVERCGAAHAVFRAVRARAVCMVNPAACKLLHKKASLAFLSDERHAALFTAEQRSAIADHIPWTRVLRERRTMHGGQEVDLVPWTAAHRERLVLKPNDDYGGRGIVLGWEVEQAAWERAVRAALEEPFIVQERIALPTEPYPSFVDGGLQVVDRMLDTAPFIAHGRHMDGCMTRLGTTSLLNVTAGGGSTVPTFVVRRRE